METTEITHTCTHKHIQMYVCMYVHIETDRERERDLINTAPVPWDALNKVVLLPVLL